MTVESLRKSTLAALKKENLDDVSYINENYIQQEFTEEDFEAIAIDMELRDGSKVRGFYIHNMSEDGAEYRYNRGTGSLATACSHDNSRKISSTLYNHDYAGSRCSHGDYGHSYKFQIYKK